MPRDRFIGDSPKDALEAFIDGWCRKNERDSYAYQHKRITANPADKRNGDAKFRFTRRETLYSPTENADRLAEAAITEAVYADSLVRTSSFTG